MWRARRDLRSGRRSEQVLAAPERLGAAVVGLVDVLDELRRACRTCTRPAAAPVPRGPGWRRARIWVTLNPFSESGTARVVEVHLVREARQPAAEQVRVVERDVQRSASPPGARASRRRAWSAGSSASFESGPDGPPAPARNDLSAVASGRRAVPAQTVRRHGRCRGVVDADVDSGREHGQEVRIEDLAGEARCRRSRRLVDVQNGGHVPKNSSRPFVSARPSGRLTNPAWTRIS